MNNDIVDKIVDIIKTCIVAAIIFASAAAIVLTASLIQTISNIFNVDIKLW